MCDPTSIIAGVGLALSAAGTAYSISQQQSAASSARQAQDTAITSQNNSFWEKATAQNNSQAQQQTAYDTAAAATDSVDADVRQRTQQAQNQQAQEVAQENAQADQIRQQADAQQTQLLTNTSGTNLAGAQAASLANRSGLADQVADNINASSPLATDTPIGGADAASKIASAADQVRTYGKQLAAVASYTAPLNTVTNSISNEQVGLMPAATANQLLQSGQQAKIAPSIAALSSADAEGTLGRSAVQDALQGALKTSQVGLDGSNSLADQSQNDATTVANNQASQAALDAQAKSGIGTILSNIGNIGTYAAGRYGTAINGYFAGTPSTDATLAAPTGNGSIITGRTAGKLT